MVPRKNDRGYSTFLKKISKNTAIGIVNDTDIVPIKLEVIKLPLLFVEVKNKKIRINQIIKTNKQIDQLTVAIKVRI